MKYLLATILICGIVQHSVASPLVFKTTKETLTNDLTEIAAFDSSKYKQVRVAVKFIGEPVLSESEAKSNLDFAQRTYDRNLELLEKGSISKENFDSYSTALNEARENYRKSKGKNSSQLNVFAIENIEEILLLDFDSRKTSFAFILDTPPSKISIKAATKGTYKIYIWASL
jgi:hypothetical protein